MTFHKFLILSCALSFFSLSFAMEQGSSSFSTKPEIEIRFADGQSHFVDYYSLYLFSSRMKTLENLLDDQKDVRLVDLSASGIEYKTFDLLCKIIEDIPLGCYEEYLRECAHKVIEELMRAKKKDERADLLHAATYLEAPSYLLEVLSQKAGGFFSEKIESNKSLPIHPSIKQLVAEPMQDQLIQKLVSDVKDQMVSKQWLSFTEPHVSHAVFSPSGKYLMIWPEERNGGLPGKNHSFSLVDGPCLRFKKFFGYSSGVIFDSSNDDVCYEKRRNLIYELSSDGMKRNKKVVCDLHDFIRSLTMSDDGKYLVAVTNDYRGCVHIIDKKTKEIAYEYQGNSSISPARLSKKNSFLIVGWDRAYNKQSVLKLNLAEKTVTEVPIPQVKNATQEEHTPEYFSTIDDNEELIASSAYHSDKVIVWVVDNHAASPVCLKSGNSGKRCLQFTPDSRYLVEHNFTFDQSCIWRIEKKQNEIAANKVFTIGHSPGFRVNSYHLSRPPIISPNAKFLVTYEGKNLIFFALDEVLRIPIANVISSGSKYDITTLAFHPKKDLIFVGSCPEESVIFNYAFLTEWLEKTKNPTPEKLQSVFSEMAIQLSQENEKKKLSSALVGIRAVHPKSEINRPQPIRESIKEPQRNPFVHKFLNYIRTNPHPDN